MNGLAKLLQFSRKRFLSPKPVLLEFSWVLKKTPKLDILNYDQSGRLGDSPNPRGWGPTSAAEEQMPLLNTDGFQV